MKYILVTGSAGFIGSNLVLRLPGSAEPVKIVGLDNLNNYYDSSLKDYRLSVIQAKRRIWSPGDVRSSTLSSSEI